MRTLASTLLLTVTLSAQGYVSPASFTHAEGPAQNSFPFGVTTVPFRYCQVHDDVPAMLISGLAFRHNATNAIYAAHTVTFDAWVSTAAVISPLTSATFDLNHGLDKLQVVTNRTYNVPASSPTSLPGEFVIDFPFDFPFPFAGNGASLCWEVQVTQKTQTATVFYDALTGGGTNPALAASRGPAGCIATGRTLGMTASPTGPMTWSAGTGSLNIAGSQLLVNGTLFVVLGLDKTVWVGGGNIALPAVIPTSTGAPSGTCTIYEDIIYVSPLTATGTGTSSFQLPIPAQVQFGGLTFYSQLLGLDAAANPFGITASNLAMHNIVPPFPIPPIARVSSSGSLGATGGVNIGVNTLVTKFY